MPSVRKLLVGLTVTASMTFGAAGIAQAGGNIHTNNIGNHATDFHATNVCGNSINVDSTLNPAFGNTCVI